MRKFFAILAAIFLALLVGVAYGAKQQGIPFSELNVQKVKQIFVHFKETGSDKLNAVKNKPAKKSVEVTAVDDGQNLSYDERMEKGDYFFTRGFLTFAANEYVKASNLEPKRSAPYFKLFDTNFALGEYEKARRNVDTILILDPQNTEARYFSAQIALKQGAFEEAKVTLDELASTITTDPRLDYDRALIHILFNEYDEAKKLLKQAQAKSPFLSLAEKIEKIMSAYREFEFAQAADPLYLSELLARALNQNTDYELAIFKLKEVLRSRNDLRDAWILLGFAYLNLEKPYFALTSFERAYEIDPEWPATQYFLGTTHQELRDFEKAIFYFNYALNNQFEPQVVVKQKLADLYMEKKDYESAVKMYKENLEANKQEVSAFVKPIWIYLDFLSNPDEALKLAELAILAFPENAMAYNLLGWAQLGNGNYTESEVNLNKAIAIDPSLAAVYLNQGKLYEKMKKNEKAITAYQKAYDLDQNGSIGRQAAERYNELLKN